MAGAKPAEAGGWRALSWIMPADEIAACTVCGDLIDMVS